MLGMLHADLDRATHTRHGRAGEAAPTRAREIRATTTGAHDVVPAVPGHQAAVVEADDVAAGDHLPKPAVEGVADLDKVLVEEDEEFPVETGRVGASHELHDHAARDVAVLVDVDGALAVRDQELAVAEAEHAQRPQIPDPVGDSVQMRLRFGRVGEQVRHGPRLFLVQSQDFDAALGRDGERGME